MSRFLRSTALNFNFLVACDYRAHEDTYQSELSELDEWLTDIWWTRSQMLTSNGNLFCCDAMTLSNPIYFEWPRAESGSHSTFTVDGQCIDVNGLPVGPCTLICHTTSDGEPRGVTISDVAGNYMCPTDIWGVAHYVDAYFTGSVDKAGTSRRDLIPV